MDGQGSDHFSEPEELEALELTAVEARVLGCLIEKQYTTPENYPLSVNSLINACNQKSSRDPVMALDESEVDEALDNLRYNYKLVNHVRLAGARAPKYGHDIRSRWNFSRQEMAIICLLLLRGPQTPGELRTRSNRIHGFDDVSDVLETLAGLTEWGGQPLVKQLVRESGKREARWAQLLSDDADSHAFAAPGTEEPSAAPSGPSMRQRIEALETEVAELRTLIEALGSPSCTCPTDTSE